MNGYIYSFNPYTGYGFIACPFIPHDIFFLIKQVVTGHRQFVEVDAPVSFDLGIDKFNRQMAINIEVLDDG